MGPILVGGGVVMQHVLLTHHCGVVLRNNSLPGQEATEIGETGVLQPPLRAYPQ
jgi:hypothetical protein